MRLLHVVPTYYPAVRYGGPIVSVHGLCKALARAGHEVHVFTTNVDGSAESDVVLNTPVPIDGVKVWYFGVSHLRRLYCAPDLGAALRGRVGEFHLVHLHSVFLWPTWAAARAARRCAVPYLISPRGMLDKELFRRKSRLAKTAWLRFIEARNLEHAAAIHVTSRGESAALTKFGLRLPCIAEIPNGVEPPIEEAPLQQHVDVLYLGRISWIKGLDRLIRAMARVPGANLVIAGNDEEGHTKELQQIAVAERVADRIKFLPPAYGTGKWHLLRSARCLALTSYSENFGNVVLEAMACGCPVIVTPEVGASQIVADTGGGVVIPGDPESLAAAMGQLLADPSRLAEMGRHAQKVLRTHSWDTVGSRMMELYRTVLSSIVDAGPS